MRSLSAHISYKKLAIISIWRVRLFNRFAPILMAFFVSLFASNQAFSKELNYCIDPNWMPFEGMIESEHAGIASDYLSIFQELTPYSFNLVPTSTWSETIELLKTGECDLTLLLNSSAEREQFLSFTIPYFFGPNVLVSRDNLPFMQDLRSIGNRSLGIVSGYRLVEEVPLYYPDVNIVEVSSELDGLKAVKNGDIDVYVGSLYSINADLQAHQIDSLRINGWISIQDKLRIGLSLHNANLVPIFNDAINRISTNQHNAILNKWSNVHYVERTDYTIVYYAIGLVSLIFLVFLWRHTLSAKVMATLNNKNQELELVKKQLQDKNEELEYLSFHDSLTKIYNRHYFTLALHDHIQHLNRQNLVSSLLMIDLDFFKNINDEYGHNVGDKILQQFSSVISKTIRAADVASRWGGEEFIILLPEANQEQAETIASRLLQSVANYTFELDIHLTLSIGISLYQKGESCESWIERADNALYEVKAMGRNGIKVAI